MGRKTGPKFYAVRVGRCPGVYSSWPQCEEQIKGFPRAKFKSFETREEAEWYAELDVPAAAPATPATQNHSLQSTRQLVKQEGSQASQVHVPAAPPVAPAPAPAWLMGPPPAPAAPPASRGEKKRKLYAVAVGARPGIYFDWDYCAKQVVGRPRSVYKGFSTPQEALQFIRAKTRHGESTEDPDYYYAVFMPALRTAAIFTDSDDAIDTRDEHPENKLSRSKKLGDLDDYLRRQIASLPPPVSQSYFSQFQDFDRIPSSQFDEEFAVLASSQGIAVGTKEYIQARTKAIGHEFLFYYGPIDPDTQEPIDPADLSDADKLGIYQAMCRAVGIEASDNIDYCIEDLKTKVLVNIVDFIDAQRLKKPVQTWPLERWYDFEAYTLMDDKRLHLESAKEYGGFLVALLQNFRRGPPAHFQRKRGMDALEEPVPVMKRARVC